jgi:hypothetical protein
MPKMTTIPNATFGSLLPGDVVTSKHGAKWRVLSTRQVEGSENVEINFETIRLGGRINMARTKQMIEAGEYPRYETETHHAPRYVWKAERAI